MGYTDQEEEITFYTILTSNCLSILGSIFVCTVYLAFKEIRVFSYKLVVMMCIADSILSLALLLPGYHGFIHCQIAAFLNSYGSLSSILWNAIIAYSLYVTVFFQNIDIASKEIHFLVIGFGAPLLVSIVPFFLDMYGEAQGWCWIKDDASDGYEFPLGTILRLVTFYIPLWIIIPINLFIYARVIKHIQEEIEYTDEQGELRRTLISKLSSYPVMLFICYFPASVKRIYDSIDSDSNAQLTLIAGILVSIQGLLNAIIYGLTSTVRVKLFNCCRKRQLIEHLESDDSISVTRRISLVRVSRRDSGSVAVY